MIMGVGKQLWSVARMGLPVFGFALVCLGAYLMSLDSTQNYMVRVILTNIAITCGFLVVLVGVFWSICHSMKNKALQRDRRGQDHSVQVYTIERPSSYPPSYEESQESQDCPDTPSESLETVDRAHMMMSLAPPLYSHDSSIVPDCRWSWEQPPPYTEVQLQPVQQGQEDAEAPSDLHQSV